MSGSLFAPEVELKRQMSRARQARFGALPEDREDFLAQMAAIAEDMNIKQSPYPAPSRATDFEEGQPS